MFEFLTELLVGIIAMALVLAAVLAWLWLLFSFPAVFGGLLFLVFCWYCGKGIMS